MLDESMKPETLDAAMEEFGCQWAVSSRHGGLDICLHAGKQPAKKDAQGHEAERQILLNKVALGQLGRKTGQGIYRWEKDKPVKGQAGVYTQDMLNGLIEPYLAEAQAVLAEGIVPDAELIDAGLIFGTGFAPFRGGPLHYLAEQKKK
jgi:3-hydroxyacyl-CoA dehydrogenase/enoyl-CoA hydratase/3-hydroxybutyryl-CoA epimerase